MSLRLEQFGRVRRITLADAARRNVLTEIVLFDGGVGPYSLHQLLFGEYLPAGFYESQQSAEHLRLERHDFPVPMEQPAHGIEAKTAEFVNPPGSVGH